MLYLGYAAHRQKEVAPHCLTVSRIMGEQTHIFVKVDLPRNCSASLTWYLPKRKNDLASPRRIPDFGARAVRPIQQSDK
jgi:hypothetical protein